MESTIPFTEKYRPKHLNEVLSQTTNIKIITECMKNERIPHMLFYGPPGTGKTSTIIALSREYYGDSFKNMILELNGSDDRGINVIRTQIKNFARVKNLVSGCNDKPKIVILDEADSLTIDAQFALRRVIEKYTLNVRFCLICNYIHKVIPAVQSRCMIFKFPKISMESCIEKIEEIKKIENLEITNDQIINICNFSNGDFRSILNFIQQKTFDNEFIINYFFRVSLEEYNTCLDLLINESTLDSKYKTLKNIFSKKTFDDFIKLYTHLGFTTKHFKFLYRLSELEYLFYLSNNSFNDIYIIALSSILCAK